MNICHSSGLWREYFIDSFDIAPRGRDSSHSTVHYSEVDFTTSQSTISENIFTISTEKAERIGGWVEVEGIEMFYSILTQKCDSTGAVGWQTTAPRS